MSLSFVILYWFGGGTLFMSHCMYNLYCVLVMMKKQQLKFIPNHTGHPLIQNYSGFPLQKEHSHENREAILYTAQ